MGPRRMRPAYVSMLLLGVLGSSGRRASAQGVTPEVAATDGEPAAPLPPAAVLIVPPRCPASPPLAVEAFTSILTAELRADGVERVTVGPLAATSEARSALATIVLTVQPCEATTRDVIVTIEDSTTSKRVARLITLGDVPDAARPRALALAVAELLRSSWLELALPDVPPAHGAAPAAVREAVLRRLIGSLGLAPESAPAPMRLERRREVDVDLDWRFFSTAGTSSYGGHMAVAYGLSTSPLWLRADGSALFGTGHDSLGDVDVGLVSGGLALLYSTPREAAFAAAIGPRVELGVAWASGHSLDQATSSYVGSGFIATASALGAFHVRLADSWRLALELQGGATLAPFEARADTRRVSAVEGAMFGVGLGVAQLR